MRVRMITKRSRLRYIFRLNLTWWRPSKCRLHIKRRRSDVKISDWARRIFSDIQDA